MNNILENLDPSLCCGCGACAQACPSGAIGMAFSDEGFLVPKVDASKCVQCGLCNNVCPMVDGGYVNRGSREIPLAFAVQHLQPDVLSLSSSGGAFTAIVDAFCDENYAIFGATFDHRFDVRHEVILDKCDIGRFRGSKYVQSDIGQCYRLAQTYLEQGKKVLFSGTPCQIAGLRSYLQKDYSKLLCVDLACHGVPSTLFFRKYKHYIEQMFGSRITHMRFRDKTNAKARWGTSNMTVSFENMENYSQCRVGFDNPYMKGYFGLHFIRSSCVNCPFARPRRVSDLTLADFWGIHDVLDITDNESDKGVSLVLVNTSLGETVFEKVKQGVMWKNVDFGYAANKNGMLLYPVHKHIDRVDLTPFLQTQSFDSLVRTYLKPRPLYRRVLSCILSSRVKRCIHKVL